MKYVNHCDNMSCILKILMCSTMFLIMNLFHCDYITKQFQGKSSQIKLRNHVLESKSASPQKGLYFKVGNFQNSVALVRILFVYIFFAPGIPNCTGIFQI